MNKLNRINVIDNLRGIAFILMIIQHIPYFYDITNGTNYCRNYIIDKCGKIARLLFILLAGYSISIEYNKNKNNFTQRRFTRSIEVMIHAIIITLVTYNLYNDKFIRFGILHFMTLATLITSFFVHDKVLSLVMLILLVSINNIPYLGSWNLIVGGPIFNSMMDWFPLIRWLPIMFIGLIIGQNSDINELNRINLIPFVNKHSILTEIGKSSLALYTGHFVLFSFIFSKFMNSNYK